MRATTLPAYPLAAERTTSTAVPWAIYAVLFASTSVVLGVIWDISWHRTIGRDTFWTPAHMGIYLGGVVSGLTCAWLALHTTFAGSPEDRATAVRFWGFRAPFGAWVSIWGAIAMLTSAPFDDWWHNAYGLDVKIISPPHMVLAAGIGAIQAGAMLMALASQNRAGGARRELNRLFLLGAGLLVLLAATVATEYIQRWDMHQSLFYQVSAGVFVFFLVSAARASRTTWPATTVALVYAAFSVFMLWLLPLFPGQPLLGPIFVPIDRFVPPDFPLLLVVPAMVIDLVMCRVAPGRWRDWGLAAALAVVFVATFLAVQWPFADFLVSPWARNDFFGSHRMDYGVPPQIQARWYQLNPPDNLAIGLVIAVAVGFVSARLGLWWGNWMSRVRR
ncbi:MAG TPA: hypothetical protein VM820_19300 [Vicinamibacterales bacterium]|jgi:hypothetical protein|nr:hypothetical protein [Vicinamibacterales bacterium]